MRKLLLSILGIIGLCLISLSPTLIKAESYICETQEPAQDMLESLGITSYNPTLTEVTLSIFIHIIRDGEGNGGLTAPQVTNAINVMTADFQGNGIYFNQLGSDEIHDDEFFSGGHFDEIIATNPHDNAIDIYFRPRGRGGRAENIPSLALIIGGYVAETSLLSHEMGHCLGLYHTHRGSLPDLCYEGVTCEDTGDNCDVCGDLVCDTPYDPCLDGLVNDECEFTGAHVLDPDTRNIMSYTLTECMTNLTTGQFQRKFMMIESAPILQNVIVPAAPTNLSWRKSGGNPLFSWNANIEPNVTGYDIYRNLFGCGPDCGPYTLIGTTNGVNNTSYLDTGVDVAFGPNFAYYHVKARGSINHLSEPSSTVAVPTRMVQKVIAGSNQPAIPQTYVLFGNHPNPFNPTTTILYDLPVESHVVVSIFDLMGREIRTITERNETAGYKQVIWDGKDNNGDVVSSGMYIYQLKAISLEDERSFSQTRKMVLLR